MNYRSNQVKISATLPALHENQRGIFESTARFRVLAAGRRFGKSRLAASVVLDSLLNRGHTVWWVSPTFDISKRVGWRMVETALRPLINAGYVTCNKSDLMIMTPNGGIFQAKSADSPEKLVGEGLDSVVIDEAGIVHEQAWIESLRPALSDKRGRALLIGTPKGRNWFWREYIKGLDNAFEDYASWHFTSNDNPFMPSGEVESARNQLPGRVFEQEYLAEFLEDGGTVFRNIRVCIDTEPLTSPTDEPIVFGVDWARDVDFTVITAMGVNSKRVYEIDRFHQVSWNLQRGRLKALAEKWKPQLIIAEENSIGQPNIEALQYEGLPIKGFMTTASSKPPLIDALALAFEQGQIRIPNNAVLINELESYELEMTKSGHIKYGAPEGGHDDTVISLALAWFAAGQRPGELSFGDAPSALSDWRG